MEDETESYVVPETRIRFPLDCPEDVMQSPQYRQYWNDDVDENWWKPHSRLHQLHQDSWS